MLEFIPIIYMTELNLFDRQVVFTAKSPGEQILSTALCQQEYKSRAKTTKHDEGIPYFNLFHGARGIYS